MATITPVKNLTTEEILYGDRTTQYRWEVLEHSNGVDYLVGTLDGVSDGSLSWVQNAAVKGSGKIEVVDLEEAAPGMLRIADLALESCRIRPVMTLNADDKTGSYKDVWTTTRENYHTNPVNQGAVTGGLALGTTSYIVNGSTGTYAVTAGWQYLQARSLPVGSRFGIRRTFPVLANAGTALRIMALANTAFPAGVNARVYLDFTKVGGGLETTQFVWNSALQFDQVYTLLNNVTQVQMYVWLEPTSAAWSGVLDWGVSWFSVEKAATSKGNAFYGGQESPIPYIRYVWSGAAFASSTYEQLRTQQEWVPGDQPVIPEIPWGTFLLEKAGEQWEGTGRTWKLSLLDRTTVPSQDVVDQSYAVAAGTNILREVRSILGSSGEYIAIDESVTLATKSGMVWEAGTSKLTIINDLLDAAGYNSLWMDGWGNLQATPRVLPADRSIMYELLTGVARELIDGESAIYEPEWTRDRDSYGVPNKVIAVQAASGSDSAALVGQWTNTDPASPYSYPSRGRWIPHVLDSVECPAGTDAQVIAFLESRARATLVQMSAVQAQVKVTHLPIPVRVGDVLRFAHTKAGIDARHVITRLDLETSSTGLMKSTLQEVISL